jgi:MoxR-like ATPase
MTTMTTFKIRSTIKTLKRFQVKSVLDLMGIPFDDQPPQGKKCALILQSLAEKSPEDYEMFYNLVYFHKLPENLGERANSAAEALKLQKLLSDHVQQIEINYVTNAVGEMDKHAAKLRTGFIDDAKQVIEDAKKQFITHQVQIGNSKPKRVQGTPPKQFKKLLQLAVSRKNILMVGPSGCGKTHVAAMLAESLSLRFGAQSCSVGVSESNFTGWLLPTEAGGAFNHIVSLFLDLYENGGMFLFDELDNADPNLLVFMNMALANDTFYLPQRFKNPVVKRHPDFVAIAAANTFGGGADVLYSSRNALDAATLDRFRVGTIAMDYDDTVEEALITNVRLLGYCRGVRQIIKRHNLAKLMSTRAMIDAQDMMDQHGWDFADVEESYFADWSPQERAMVRSELDSVRNVAMGVVTQ